MATVSVQHYENFPVASLLCPAALRPPIVAIYHFARTADDIADEGDASTEHRLAELGRYRKALTQCLALESEHSATPQLPQKEPQDAAHEAWVPVFQRLRLQLHAFNIPAQHLHHLLDAFEQDIPNPHYASREQLLHYCARSANPVGRMLLHLWGIGDDLSLAQSDRICTALQLINFWQDISVDLPRGRSYFAQQDLAKHGLSLERLQSEATGAPVCGLVRELCEWAAGLMHEGAPLALRVPGRAGWELRLVVQGGLRILEKIAQMNYASAQRRPKLSAWDVPVLLWRAARMRSTLASRLAPIGSAQA